MKLILKLIDRLLEKTAAKRGFRLEDANSLVLIDCSPRIRAINVMMVEYENGFKQLNTLSGHVLQKSDSLRVYV